mmetsp:Transcript_32514/g.78705  ORF Transcript_32514/g.78705 Transcript_32514/m.78705 type:complete len:106 (-) Transcript_32514:141-458(-)
MRQDPPWGDAVLPPRGCPSGPRMAPPEARRLPAGGRRARQWRRDERFGINDKIGLVLNLDAGTLWMFKNGIYRGELCSGLEGEYLWVCCLFVRCNGGDIRIADWE